ncbi:MAG TPA: PEP-CTERM sorting domain-containing protein [Tepidisphaeraceae bacterium]|nr:PEP-CTERM sorting domain-containing protein [Tepidisphaeraceae bacterium]
MVRKNRRLLHLASAGAVFGMISAISPSAAKATIITQWSFTAKVTGPDNSPSPTTGTGTAISLGMTNSYSYAGGETSPTTTNDDITQPGSKSQLQDYTWRIRGFDNASGQPGNGWNNSAPNYTQGAEFEVPTTGYNNIGISFDWYCTTQGVANMQFLYTLDDTQATPTWVPVGSDLIATANNFYGAPASSSTTPTNSFDLTGIAGVGNDPNFAFEMVSVQPISTDTNYSTTTLGDYASAGGGNYNNSSGNWSFGNVTVSEVPEPASASLLSLAGLTLLRRRQGKRA